MSPEDRRQMIVRAVLPLVVEHGAAVTTSQIARAAGICEGTVFRAFKDKDELLQLHRFLDRPKTNQRSTYPGNSG